MWSTQNLHVKYKKIEFSLYNLREPICCSIEWLWHALIPSLHISVSMIDTIKLQLSNTNSSYFIISRSKMWFFLFLSASSGYISRIQAALKDMYTGYCLFGCLHRYAVHTLPVIWFFSLQIFLSYKISILFTSDKWIYLVHTSAITLSSVTEIKNCVEFSASM